MKHEQFLKHVHDLTDDSLWDIDYKAEVEMLCFRYWRLLPEPKPEYTKWFYSGRKALVRKLFSKEVENE